MLTQLARGSVLALVLVACGEPRATKPVTKAAAALARPRVVAHRGASHEAPENTLAAFRRAWDLGVECVELDVHVTSDGIPVVIHDATTKRTGGLDRAVAAQTLAEIRTLDAGSWKGAAFRGENIPTLAEVLDSIPPGRTLFLELKSELSTIPAVVRALASNDPRPRGGKLALQAYDADSLAALSRAIPGAPAYWTLDPPVGEDQRILPYPPALIAEAKQRGFAGLALDYRAVTEDFLARARAAGLEMDVWTINEPAELARWLGLDVRWIETDRPELSVPPS
ncbi:MAG: glycerophosphodiester phosphodiesterase family protein [Kofleriaceae bacterium]